MFVSYDEKPGIQAIGNVHPDRNPIDGNSFTRRDYEYKRHGTLSLLAGIDLISGKVHSLIRERHKSADFIDFLKGTSVNSMLEKEYSSRELFSVS